MIIYISKTYIYIYICKLPSLKYLQQKKKSSIFPQRSRVKLYLLQKSTNGSTTESNFGFIPANESLDKSIRGSWDFNLAWTHLALKTLPILGTHGSTMSSAKSAAVASTSNTSCARAINLSRCRIERLMDIRGRCVRTVITADLWACVHLVNSRELPWKRSGRGRAEATGFARTRLIHTYAVDDPRMNHELWVTR